MENEVNEYLHNKGQLVKPYNEYFHIWLRNHLMTLYSLCHFCSKEYNTGAVSISGIILTFFFSFITKTHLFKYTENFTTKKWKFSNKKSWYLSYFCSKHRLWVLIRTANDAVLMSTHNLCFEQDGWGSSNEYPQSMFWAGWGSSNEYPQSMFWAEIRKNNAYPCKPQFYYIKVGFKGVKIL